MIYEVHYLSFKYHIYAFLLAFSQSLICHLVQHAFNLSNIYSDYIWSNKTSQSTITTQFPSLLDD